MKLLLAMLILLLPSCQTAGEAWLNWYQHKGGHGKNYWYVEVPLGTFHF